MGRSVYVPRAAVAVAYRTYEWEDSENEMQILDAQDEWDDYKDFITELCQDLMPSLRVNIQGHGDEGTILLQNAFVKIGISQYFGLVAIWMIPRTNTYSEHSGLIKGWVKVAKPKFEQALSELQLIGVASNGEAFFTRVDK